MLASGRLAIVYTRALRGSKRVQVARSSEYWLHPSVLLPAAVSATPSEHGTTPRGLGRVERRILEMMEGAERLSSPRSRGGSPDSPRRRLSWSPRRGGRSPLWGARACSSASANTSRCWRTNGGARKPSANGSNERQAERAAAEARARAEGRGKGGRAPGRTGVPRAPLPPAGAPRWASAGYWRRCPACSVAPVKAKRSTPLGKPRKSGGGHESLGRN